MLSLDRFAYSYLCTIHELKSIIKCAHGVIDRLRYVHNSVNSVSVESQSHLASGSWQLINGRIVVGVYRTRNK